MYVVSLRNSEKTSFQRVFPTVSCRACLLSILVPFVCPWLCPTHIVFVYFVYCVLWCPTRVVMFVLFICLRLVSCVPNVASFSGFVHSWFPPSVCLTFIYMEVTFPLSYILEYTFLRQTVLITKMQSNHIKFIEFALIIIKVKRNHAVNDSVCSFCHYLDDKIFLNWN